MTRVRTSLPQFKGFAAFMLLLASSLIFRTTQAGASTNYTLSPDSIDAGGQRGASVNYVLNPAIMPGHVGASIAYTLRSGFSGQLADAIATAIDITASPLTVNETSTRQLSATLIFDDLSTQPLAASSVTWSVQSGPISNISNGGLVTAAAVYQNANATAQGTYQTFTNTLTLDVLNNLPDNFGTYAADGIDDDWQVQYFGLPPNSNAGPLVDPDFDGQNNLFEYTAGVIPTNRSSRFLFNIAPVTGQPSQKNIIFNPRFADRTYTIMTSTTLLSPGWSTLTTTTTVDLGLQRTITDTSATGTRKFYRIEISKP